MMLLDTCTFLWLSSDPAVLPEQTLGRIQASQKRYLSSITALEISLKIRDGKLSLPKPFPNWLHEIKQHLHLEEVEVSAPIAHLSGQLPRIHRDPFDRILIATAMIKKLTLLTPDASIHQYPDLKYQWG